MAFTFKRSLTGGRPQLVQLEMEVSTTLKDGDPCNISSNGKVQKCQNQTDKPLFISAAAQVSTATGGETGLFMHASPYDAIWETSFTPTYNKVTAQSGGSTTTALIADAATVYSSNAFQGGQIGCWGNAAQGSNLLSGTGAAMTYPSATIFNQLNKGPLLTITASSAVASPPGNCTLTVVTPFSNTPDGSIISVTPIGMQVVAGQLVATSLDSITQDPTKFTSGYLRVLNVDVMKGLAEVMFLG